MAIKQNPTKQMTRLTLNQGFTLIEILVVMVIIGIIAVLGIGNFQSSQLKARDTARKSDLRQITTALEAYYNDYGSYPLDINGEIAGCAGGQVCNWGDPFIDDNGTVYMVALPIESRDTSSYYYSSVDGRSFQLYARFENTLDQLVPKNGSDVPQVYSGTDCGALTCNYGVSSSNVTPVTGRTLMTE